MDRKLRDSLSTILLVMVIFITGNVYATPDDSTNAAKFLGAPVASASSDEGIVIGAVAGFARESGDVVYLSAYQSTKRYTGLGLRGEFNTGLGRFVVKNHLTRILRRTYPAKGDVVDEFAHATVNRLQIDMAALKPAQLHCRIGESATLLEYGPACVIDISQGESSQDANDNAIDISGLPEFQRASTALIGARIRLRSTSASRPLNGFVFDSRALIGRTSGESLASPRFDQSFSFWLAIAYPLVDNARFYLRGSWQWQNEAPAPIRNWLGGDNTLRGQPDHRDLGREVVMGRAQFHQTVISEWFYPMKTVNRVLSFFPVWAVDVEVVGFYDIGRCGDPDFDWNPIRQGYGGGFRVVAPPELTLSFDFAITPNGGTKFYFGMGETL